MSDRRQYTRTVEPEFDKASNKTMTRVQSRAHRISFPDVEAWERVNAVRLEPWQVAGITLLDDRFVEIDGSPLPILPPKQGVGDAGKRLFASLKMLAIQEEKKHARYR